MIVQCIYCSNQFRTNQEDKNYCNDCEDQALSIAEKADICSYCGCIDCDNSLCADAELYNNPY